MNLLGKLDHAQAQVVKRFPQDLARMDGRDLSAKLIQPELLP